MNKYFCTLPRQKNDFIIKSMNKRTWNILPNHVKPIVAYIGRKLCSYFQIKNKNFFEHKHGVIFTIPVTRNTLR